ncbi:MAG: hypothetical protein CVU54_01760 [Deltaproteobacteria bacterium HGW-Deltaproteobacteria-12]|jgi:hypothetical protein|nr:MAG: hypothetical protein CVU54_01760 [Deltaproteobacteria bacterium HGW-Deltaproteobacteria-12]
MQEILVVVAIALAIFFLPRLMGSKPAPVKNSPELVPALKGWMRLAILVTIFWVAGSAAFLQPWEKNTILFLYVGLGPVVAGWGAFWVWAGYHKYRR